MGMERAAAVAPQVVYCEDVLTAVSGTDAVVLATAWPEFSSLNFRVLHQEMEGSVFLDTRNAWDAAAITSAGCRYLGLGRPDERASSRELMSLPLKQVSRVERGE
jgi:UDPglucose 6-dehydrogenase